MNEERITINSIQDQMAALSKEWDTPILFGKHEGGSVAYQPINPDDLEKYLAGEEVEYTWDDFEKMTLPIIKVSREYMEAAVNWMEPRHFEAMLRHEYGHILCEYKIEEILMTEKEMVEYRIKAKIIDDLLWFYSQQKRMELYYDICRIYNQLQLERLANEHGGVNLQDLIEANTQANYKGSVTDPLPEPWSKLVEMRLGQKDHKTLRKMSAEVRDDAKTKETTKRYMNMLLNIYYIIFPPEDLAEYKRLVGVN
jgi:hypothetical protein